MDRDKFEQLVRQGVEAIPQRFLKKLNNVDIVIEDEPTEEQKKEKTNNRHLGGFCFIEIYFVICYALI